MVSRAFSGMRGVVRGGGAAGRLFVSAAASIVLIALLVGLVLGRVPLKRHVASLTTRPIEVRFNWPVSPSGDEKRVSEVRTWLPPAVQRDLAQIALASIKTDPFDQPSLESARQALLATGWFARIESVKRTASGFVDVTADWRVPAAVVKHKGREYLVAIGGEVLRLPPRTPVMKGSMPVISNAGLGPTVDSLGVVYGAAWPGGDVQAAVDLLRHLRRIPEFGRIVGVDLALFGDSGHLTLLTDAGAKIVWGSAITELGPGQVSVDTRRARLRDILQTRFDESQRLIEIHTPVVLVDKTASAR